MSDLYPLLLLPEFVERVWGSRDISALYPHKSARGVGQTSDAPIGEVWLTGDQCRVANGPLAGQTLKDVTAKYGRALLGEAAPSDAHFPLLLKFLFPKEKLSVQVHPDDDGARAIGQACGKTECWYIIAAEPGAQVGLGLKPGITSQQVKQGITEKTLERMMNWIDVHPGELIYVDAGTLHAIGPGAIILETQQNSDTTYRLYDYGRPRELHIEEGLRALKTETRAGKVPARNASGSVSLVESPCFCVDKFIIRETRSFIQPEGKASAHILVALDGGGVIEVDGHRPVTLARGECAIVPASLREYRVRPQWALELCRAALPCGKVSEPSTFLTQANAIG